ncbi:ribulose-phosphate 3-epimerase [Diplocloster agilis]|uniref:Ribulose-phosphate 3-epimerase n=1 Tax=Diplocloster agilis TaxID=2850323 RepID=A0A949K148_9FIRM|nr:ribulose-phosphate 3-epimerase [Diplocloster agilis]MBU9738998.1 ribulose-phosphate 3-epimerase [Diplocloster agilis]MBU9745840.1 ribulose-phosphate 3-epimerase [Diplocloster agilis]
MKNNYILGGSVSCFDLYNLERQFKEIHEAPIDFMHYDVVDGRFNQCLILGLPTLQMMRPHTELPIEVHLAVYEPELYIAQFIEAGADIITIHPEGTKDLMEAFRYIRKLGAKPALALRSETIATEDMLPAMEEAEYIIKLTVNPGFSGQKIQPAAFEKMSALRRMLDTHGIDTKIVADGNVNTDTIPTLVQHGASMLIGGTSGLFLKGRSVKECAQAMLDAMKQ